MKLPVSTGKTASCCPPKKGPGVRGDSEEIRVIYICTMVSKLGTNTRKFTNDHGKNNPLEDVCLIQNLKW